MTVLPRSASVRIKSLISRQPIGSSPEVGSSRDDQVGVVDERLRQADAALHALREFADVTTPGVAQPDHLDQLLGALATFLRVYVKEAAEKIDRLV